VRNARVVVADSSTVSNNTAWGSGGGLAAWGDSSVSLTSGSSAQLALKATPQ
jgi:hypothetical protein